jgi:Mce-associated membrane protein
VVREVVHVVDAICYLGYLRPLWHARGRTVADSAAATDVVTGRPGPRIGWVDPWTVAAAVLCALAVGFTLGGSSTNGGYSSTCDTTAVGGAQVEQVDLDWGSITSSTRLGVTRTSGTSKDLVATWVFAGDTAPPDGTRLSITVTADDGDAPVTRTGTVVGGDLVVDGPSAPGAWTMRLPADEVARTGPDRRWHADVTTPGGTVEVCSGEHY